MIAAAHAAESEQDIPRASLANAPGPIREFAERLAHSPYLPLRTVVCSYANGVLTLQGRVPTYYLRQVAWSMAADLQGIMKRVDMIEVRGLTARAAGR